MTDVRQELQRKRVARQQRMRTDGRRVLEASWRAFADIPPEEIEPRVAEAVAAALEELRREGRA